MSPRPIGINHVALDVGSLDDALAWWRALVDFELRGRGPRMAFIDLGDQFIALAEGEPDAGGGRHFGLVVDDREALRRTARDAGLDVQPSGSLRLHDPWGNIIEVVDYRDVQFTKAGPVARAMGVDGLEKSESAREELRAKGLL